MRQSDIPEGATLPEDAITCPWIVGDVTRRDGVLQVPVVLPHGLNPPRETLFPAALDVIADGPIPLPAYDKEPQL